jgi:simple sugar transport system substrate-binding protein
MVTKVGFKKTGEPCMNAKKPLRFIFITPFADIPFFESVKQGMNDAAKQLEISCTFTGPHGLDTAAQVKVTRQAIADGYDGIVLNIFHAAELAEVIGEASSVGIAVAAFNVDDQSVPTKRLCSVCQNLFKAGQVLAVNASPFIQNGSRIYVVMHDRGVSALEERFKGMVDGFKGKNITCEILIGGDSENTARVVTEQLKANPEVKVVLGTGQSDTEGIGFAIERNFKEQGYNVAGFDLSAETLRMVKEGVIRFAIDQQPYIQGYYPVVQLAHYCRYGIVPSNIDAGHNVIDKAKAASVIELSKKNYR